MSKHTANNHAPKAQISASAISRTAGGAAVLGTAIGTAIISPVGTIVGGVVGAVVGAIAPSILSHIDPPEGQTGKTNGHVR